MSSIPRLTLYFLRHGETDYNRKGIVQGSGVDSDLNPTGQQQAAAFFAYYQDIRFDAVYASKLKRTHQTLHPWNLAGYEFNIHEGLNELNWGIHEGKPPTPDQRGEFLKMLRKWEVGQLHAKVEEGESPLEAWERAKPFFDELPARHPGHKLLICSHGRQLRVILSNLLGEGMTRMEQYSQKNTGLTILTVDNEGTYHVELINDVRHLDHHSLAHL